MMAICFWEAKHTTELCVTFDKDCTVLVKSFAHLSGIFFLASLEEMGKLWKW